MADAPDLGSGAARCGGSSPLSRTTLTTELSDIYLKAFLHYTRARIMGSIGAK